MNAWGWGEFVVALIAGTVLAVAVPFAVIVGMVLLGVLP